MSQYIVSARKYRPSTFKSVVGQKALTATLKNAIATQRLAHSYLFCGSRGVGKTSCARIFAKTINCEHPTAEGEACNECDSCRSFNNGTSMNIIELDAASNNGVDDIRAIVEQVQIPPSTGQYRVFIVDEVHMLSAAAFNAFLKTLEEPPHYVIFILATTEKHKILPTILSRCQIYDFARITVRDMIDHLKYVASEEGYTTEDAALGIIARKADGAMRDALSIFDQVAASTQGNITYKATIDNLNVLDYSYYNQLTEAFLAGDVMQTWLIYKEIRDKGFDSQFFINGLADYMRDLMVARSPQTMILLETDDEARQAIANEAVKVAPEFIFRAMSLLNTADLNYRQAANKQFLVELTLAKICQIMHPEGIAKPLADPKLHPVNPPSTPIVNPTEKKAVNPTPTPKPAPAPIPVAPKPVSKPKVVIHTSFSINGYNAAEKKAEKVETRQNRNETFTDEQFLQAWQGMANRYDKEITLEKIFSSYSPKRLHDTTFQVDVTNEIEKNKFEEKRTEILQGLHDSLKNDLIELEIHVHQGEPSPQIWSESQVLEHMKKENPLVNNLISDLQLTLQ